MRIDLIEKEFEALGFAVNELSGTVESGTCDKYEKDALEAIEQIVNIRKKYVKAKSNAKRK